MNWRIKCAAQRVFAMLPATLADEMYYWLQKRIGGLRSINPISRLQAGAAMCAKIRDAGSNPAGGSFLEVGTGQQINLPIALWLAGADRIITVDIRHNLRSELVRMDMEYIRGHLDDIRETLGQESDNGRLDDLVRFLQGGWQLGDLLDLTRIQYITPADATRLDIPSASIDFHVSNTVLEHIDPSVLRPLMAEGRRVIKSAGLFVHNIDLSDHFSHADSALSPINFLRFSEKRWNRLAGNKFAFTNRLRADDFLRLFDEMDLRIVSSESHIDESVLTQLRKGALTLDNVFSGKAQDVLATTSLRIVAAKR